MTDHLPECIAADPEAISGAMWCICDRLRACEQRVLNTAREAVERASSFMQPLGPALAAIDALRGEP